MICKDLNSCKIVIFVLRQGRRAPGGAERIKTYMSFAPGEPDAARGQKGNFVPGSKNPRVRPGSQPAGQRPKSAHHYVTYAALRIHHTIEVNFFLAVPRRFFVDKNCKSLKGRVLTEAILILFEII
jgi:hypothetical protein